MEDNGLSNLIAISFVLYVYLVSTLTASGALIMSFLTIKLPSSWFSSEIGEFTFESIISPQFIFRSFFLLVSLFLRFSPFSWTFPLLNILEIAGRNFPTCRCNDSLSITHFSQLCRAIHSFQRDINELYHFVVLRTDAFRGGSDVSVR